MEDYYCCEAVAEVVQGDVQSLKTESKAAAAEVVFEVVAEIERAAGKVFARSGVVGGDIVVHLQLAKTPRM
jgi:hypothetical protein